MLVYLAHLLINLLEIRRKLELKELNIPKKVSCELLFVYPYLSLRKDWNEKAAFLQFTHLNQDGLVFERHPTVLRGKVKIYR
jgi:hypothetical protein